MAKDFTRADRIAQQMQRELAQLLSSEVKDPRIGMVTITDVEVSRDYSHAKVFYTVLGEDHAAIAEGLQRASGFLRHEVFHRMKLRTVPQLSFSYDSSVERGMHLSRLIDQANSGEKES